MSTEPPVPPMSPVHRAARPCPICGKPATPTDQPFCSKRCADVDLHRWLGGHYVIPASPQDETDDDESAPPVHP